MAKVADSSCDLGPLLGLGGIRDECEGSGRGLGLLDFERLFAAAASGGEGAKLHQFAVVTTQDFALSLSLAEGRHHSCHSCVLRKRGPEQGPQRGRPITETCDVPRVTLGIG